MNEWLKAPILSLPFLSVYLVLCVSFGSRVNVIDRTIFSPDSRSTGPSACVYNIELASFLVSAEDGA